MTILCKHCGKQIDQAKLIGFSLICPKCKKPQNGHPRDIIAPDAQEGV